VCQARTALQQAEVYLMIERRRTAAGIATKLGNHSRLYVAQKFGAGRFAPQEA
jgi:hypothetical protein